MERPKGILLGKETKGDLQCWIDGNPLIRDEQKLRFCQEATEVIVHVHDRDTLHCDLRPENYLLSDDGLRLCDFGGSKFGDLYGCGLPNAGFYDPKDHGPVSHSTDIYALGSCMYTIFTGHFPHDVRGEKTAEEEQRYSEKVNGLLLEDHLPDVTDIMIGHIISACWTSNITAANVLRKLLAIRIPTENQGV